MVFLWSVGMIDLKSHISEVTEDDMKEHFLDQGMGQETDTDVGGVNVPDGFSMINTAVNELSCTCSNKKFVTWTFGIDSETNE